VQSLFEGRTQFVGYETFTPVRASVRAILVDGERAEMIEAGQTGELALDRTPFYAESGGQTGDTGFITKDGVSSTVSNTFSRGTATTHKVKLVAGVIQVGDEVEATIDLEKRRLTMKNHTATHLLQAALRQVLGPHVKQAGSLVTPERLRFDFTHYAPLTRAEIQKIEDLVNEQIWLNTPVQTTVMDLDEAMKCGAVALFGEKYQEKVRVVEIPGFSKELCGGTHVTATGTLGLFKIANEGGISAGIRRIEAVTGPASLARFRSDEQILDAIQEENKIARQDIPGMIEKILTHVKDLQRQIAELKAQSARSNIGEILACTREILGIKVLAYALPPTDRNSLRNLADELKQKLGSGIVILGTPQEDKAALVVMVSSDISKRIPAGQIIKLVAPIMGGAGGGKPELAEAGGKDASKLSEAIEQSYSLVEGLLKK
jgi:alanyl-tRNA synthetase